MGGRVGRATDAVLLIVVVLTSDPCKRLKRLRICDDCLHGFVVPFFGDAVKGVQSLLGNSGFHLKLAAKLSSVWGPLLFP